VKILDLGLARLRQPVRGSTTRNLTVLAGNDVMQGTPDYMAPEQALSFHSADIRADIYSLGCTLYFCLIGRPPFAGGTVSQKLLRHQQVMPTPVQELRPEVRPESAAVLSRMLAKDPADRFQTPGEVAAALATWATPLHFLGTAPSTGSTVEILPAVTLAGIDTPPAPAPPSEPAVRRSRKPLFAGAVGGVVLIGVGALLFLGTGPAPSHTEPTPVAKPPAGPLRVAADERDRVPSLRFADGEKLVLLPDNLIRQASTLTVEAWFKAQSGVLLGYQGGAFPGHGDYVPVLYVGTDGLLRGQVWNGAVNPIATRSKVNDGRWHHAALVADGKAKLQSLYLDGELVGTRPGPINHTSMANNQLGIGFSDGWPAGKRGWFPLNGSLGEVRFWSVPRSAQEIQQARETFLTGTEPGLRAYFPLTEPAGDVLLDRSPHGRNGTLGGGVAKHKPVRVVPTADVSLLRPE
jgi:hypothetical protein